MRTGWKVAIAVALTAAVGTLVVAGVALADGGAGADPRAQSPATPLAADASGDTRQAFDALIACAVDNGLDDVVAGAVAGNTSFADVASALSALGACEDEARALGEAVKQDLARPGALLGGIATETAACLEREGVTLSGIAGALFGGERTDDLEAAAEACLPDLSSLTR